MENGVLYSIYILKDVKWRHTAQSTLHIDYTEMRHIFFASLFFLNKKKKHIPQFCKSHCCAVFLACDSKHRSPDDVILKKMSGHAS